MLSRLIVFVLLVATSAMVNVLDNRTLLNRRDSYKCRGEATKDVACQGTELGTFTKLGSMKRCCKMCMSTPGCTAYTQYKNKLGKPCTLYAQCAKRSEQFAQTHILSPPSPPVPGPSPPAPTPAPPAPAPPGGWGPGTGEWEVVKPEQVGLSSQGLSQAHQFINEQVLERSCLLVIKDGKIAYEAYHTAPDPPVVPATCNLTVVENTGKGKCKIGPMHTDPDKPWKYNNSHTFGCAGHNSMYATNKCGGTFVCNNRLIRCPPCDHSDCHVTCGCDLENKPHNGYSMTKSIGAYIIFKAATEDKLDMDADITDTYGIASPRPYAVTTRMIMAQILAGDKGPGQMWEYDELGNLWIHVLPKIVLAATGHEASYYLAKLHAELGLSDMFTWPEVNTKWARGAAGTCRDWARWGQLILNRGFWGGKQVIKATLFDEMSVPMKSPPYNSYSNPCYGLLVWINADKSKYPGCCWEASRLPSPICNNDTFMDNAVTDMTLIIGLYGQVLMTLPSVNTLVVGFGTDLRPIEPVRIGYYPGLCSVLGLPCSKVPALPVPRCGETLQCDGLSAQCYSGGSWNHSEPMPGGSQCIACFQNKMPQFFHVYPEAKPMVQKNCPRHPEAIKKFMECYCHGPAPGEVSNPFGRWPTTTTTTPKPSPCPPPEPRPVPPTPPPLPTCMYKPSCIDMLEKKKCKRHVGDIEDGALKCYKCLAHNNHALKQAGCPQYRQNHSLVDSAFCWCGLMGTGRRRHVTKETRSMFI